MSSDRSNGVDTNEGGGAAAAVIDERRATLRRRAKLLSILDGALEAGGIELDGIMADMAVTLKEATIQEVRLDLDRLIVVKLAEKRGPKEPGGEPRYQLTLRGETAVQEKGATWHSVAEMSLRGEEEPKAPVDPATVASTSDPNAWIKVAEASADRERAEKAAGEAAEETKAAKKGGRKKKAADAQLGLGSAPGRFTMSLPCPVGEEEREAAIREHLEACDEIDAIEDERKAANEGFAARRKTAEAREQELRSKAREAMKGTRLTEVECEQRLDGSTMRVIRCDTGETVEERAAKAEELTAVEAPLPTTSLPEGAEVRPPEGSAQTPDEAQATGSDLPPAEPEAPKKRGRKAKVAALLN